MKKIILSLLWLGLLFEASGQLKLIKTGRPQSFEYNNAERVVGKRWGITFSYIAFNGTDFDLLDSITAVNAVTEKKLEAKKGAGWNEAFRMETDLELKRQQELRTRIMASIKDVPPFPLMIHFGQGRCKNTYHAYVFSLMELEDRRTYNVNYRYKANVKTGKVSLRSEKTTPIHFEYPENGITRDGKAH